LDTKEIDQIGRALATHAGPESNNIKTPSAMERPTSAPPSEEERKAHWEAVKPQLVLSEDLSEQQRTELLAVLVKHCLVFSKDKGDLGLVQGYFHKIDTGDTKPIKLPPHRLSHAEKEEIAKQMQPMIEWKVIRRSKSPYSDRPSRTR
jgi:hypothetical protein